MLFSLLSYLRYVNNISLLPRGEWRWIYNWPTDWKWGTDRHILILEMCIQDYIRICSLHLCYYTWTVLDTRHLYFRYTHLCLHQKSEIRNGLIKMTIQRFSGLLCSTRGCRDVKFTVHFCLSVGFITNYYHEKWWTGSLRTSKRRKDVQEWHGLQQ